MHPCEPSLAELKALWSTLAKEPTNEENVKHLAALTAQIARREKEEGKAKKP